MLYFLKAFYYFQILEKIVFYNFVKHTLRLQFYQIATTLITNTELNFNFIHFKISFIHFIFKHIVDILIHLHNPLQFHQLFYYFKKKFYSK